MAQFNGTSVWVVFTGPQQFKVLVSREAAQAYAWRIYRMTEGDTVPTIHEREVKRHGGTSY